MGAPQIIFTDRDGDRLEAVSRDLSEFGDRSGDPVISIIHTKGYEVAQSIVMTDEELDHVLRDLCRVFGYEAVKCEGPA